MQNCHTKANSHFLVSKALGTTTNTLITYHMYSFPNKAPHLSDTELLQLFVELHCTLPCLISRV